MYGREELKTYTSSELYDRATHHFKCGTCYLKYDADKVMKVMENRIAELESQLPKWISVKDRLPEEYGDYLVVYKNYNDKDVIDVFTYAFDTKQGYACWVDDFEEDTSVTHWMPLPPHLQTNKKV